jgi:hypothetical protein
LVTAIPIGFCLPCQLLDDDGRTTCLMNAMPINWCLPYQWLCVHHEKNCLVSTVLTVFHRANW